MQVGEFVVVGVPVSVGKVPVIVCVGVFVGVLVGVKVGESVAVFVGQAVGLLVDVAVWAKSVKGTP